MGECKVLLIPFFTFTEKIRLTKKYSSLAKIQIIDNKYIYMEMRG